VLPDLRRAVGHAHVIGERPKERARPFGNNACVVDHGGHYTICIDTGQYISYFDSEYIGDMTTTPSDVLRSARIARGFASAAEAARHFGWNEVTYTAHENGGRGIKREAAQRYGVAFGIDPATLLGLTTGNVHFDADQGVNVIGTAAWGVWRDARMVKGQQAKSVQVPRSATSAVRAAIIVGDESVNRVLAPGEIAIYEPVSSANLASGKLIVVKQMQGHLEELSIRRVLSAVDGELKLADHSVASSYRDVLTVPISGSSAVEILGVVVAKYAPL